MDDPPDPPIDALMVLIAELLREGLIDHANLASMSRRMRNADMPDIAERVESLPLSNMLDDPDEIRAGLHIVGGGNEDD